MAETAMVTEDLWQQAWESLRMGKEGSRSPFHQGVLATQSARGPEARYVVLREVQQENVLVGFNTDIRSTKVQQLRDAPQVSWCFYGDGLQIRLQGDASLHYRDDISRQYWQQASIASRRAYLADVAPGNSLPLPELETAATLGNIPMTPAEEEFAIENFMAVQIRITRMDVLLLKSSGHLRACFTFANHIRHAQWLAP